MVSNKDMLTREQQRLGSLLVENPTIIDPGTWWYGNVDTPEPSYEVEEYKFVDVVSIAHWTKLGECNAVLLSEPSPQNAVLLLPQWGDGFERLKLLVRPYFALLWENATNNTRIHLSRVHVAQWESKPVLIAEQHYSESAKRAVPWSMYTTGSTSVEKDADVA